MQVGWVDSVGCEMHTQSGIKMWTCSLPDLGSNPSSAGGAWRNGMFSWGSRIWGGMVRRVTGRNFAGGKIAKIPLGAQ